MTLQASFLIDSMKSKAISLAENGTQGHFKNDVRYVNQNWLKVPLHKILKMSRIGFTPYFDVCRVLYSIQIQLDKMISDLDDIIGKVIRILETRRRTKDTLETLKKQGESSKTHSWSKNMNHHTEHRSDAEKFDFIQSDLQSDVKTLMNDQRNLRSGVKTLLNVQSDLRSQTRMLDRFQVGLRSEMVGFKSDQMNLRSIVESLDHSQKDIRSYVKTIQNIQEKISSDVRTINQVQLQYKFDRKVFRIDQNLFLSDLDLETKIDLLILLFGTIFVISYSVESKPAIRKHAGPSNQHIWNY